jgi:hypothetical protein
LAIDGWTLPMGKTIPPKLPFRIMRAKKPPEKREASCLHASSSCRTMRKRWAFLSVFQPCFISMSREGGLSFFILNCVRDVGRDVSCSTGPVRHRTPYGMVCFHHHDMGNHGSALKSMIYNKLPSHPPPRKNPSAPFPAGNHNFRRTRGCWRIARVVRSPHRSGCRRRP